MSAIRTFMVLVSLITLPGTAEAAQSGGQAVSLCVQVSAKEQHHEGLEKLVLAQLAHHPTHRPVATGCLSQLEVQLFKLEGTYYLTVRINRQVPVRFALERFKDLEPKLVEALRRVLNHDPVYLARDIRELSAIQRAMHSILKRGRNTWRLELFETLIGTGDSVAFASGGGFSVSRGSEHWYVFARVYAAGALSGDQGAGPTLRVMAGGDLGLTYEFLARSLITPYLGAGLGLQVLHLEGRLKEAARDLESVTVTGGTFSLRGGVRFFRASNFELDLFVAGYLPMFVTKDVDSLLMDDYTPSMQFGLGVGF